MKPSGFLICFFLFAACGSKDKPAVNKGLAISVATTKKAIKPATFNQYRLNADYIVVDTGKYSNDGPMTGGAYAIVRKNGAARDTIDLDFGINDLGNHIYLYRAMRHETDPSLQESKGNLVLEQASYLLVEKDVKTELKKLTANFDDYFSSPNAINNKIYFWQLEKIDSVGGIKVLAAEYNPVSRKTASHFLLNDTLETDDSGYFPSPAPKKDTIIFWKNEEKKWKFSKDFKLYK